MMATKVSAESLLKEIKAALHRERGYRKMAREAISICEADNAEHVPFNILYSNTETLAPALYNSTPRPVVQRRFKDKDPLAAAACQLGKRTLEFLSDTGDPHYVTLDVAMQEAVQNSLLPGRAVLRVQYDADIKYEKGKNDKDEEIDVPADINKEIVCLKPWPWDKFLMGYALSWEKVPWIAYEHAMTKADLEKNFGKKIAEEIEIKEETSGEESRAEGGTPVDNEHKLSAAESVTPVYEIWHKGDRKIYWVARDWPKEVLKEDADPYELAGFYDCPDQLRLTRRIKGLIPRTLYHFYEVQAKELNSLTLRIRSIVKQIKVRGIYDTTLGSDIKNIFDEESDGAVVPVTNPALMNMAQGGLERAIWLTPIDKYVQTYVQLVQQREQVKQTIYEITGISDILRGSSVASETATAQNIKNQWGTLRLKRMQKLVSVFARDVMRLMLELAVTKFSPETLKKMTGLPFPLEVEKQQAQALVQEMMRQAPPPIPGAPPPQLPPEVIQAQETAKLPSIEQLQKMLADDYERAFRVDIETNSTIEAEAVEDKQDMAELLNAISQVMNSLAPMVTQKVMPFTVAKSILLTVVRRYNFGPELEESLEGMQEPQQQGSPEELKKMQAELEKQKQLLAKEKEAIEQAKMQLSVQQREFAMEQQLAKRELALEAKFAQKQQQLQQQDQLRKLENSINTGLSKAEEQANKMQETATETTKTVSENKEVVSAMSNMSQQFGELMQAMTQAMEAMAKAASSPKQITDSKGRTMVVQPMTGG